MPVDYKIRNFTLKIIVLIKNSGLIFSLKHQKNLPNGQVTNYKKQTILNNMNQLENNLEKSSTPIFHNQNWNQSDEVVFLSNSRMN